MAESQVGGGVSMKIKWSDNDVEAVMDECEEESDEDFDAISSASETDNDISSSDEKSSGGSSDEFDPE